MRLGRGGDSDGVHFPVSRFAMCIVFYLHLHLHGSQTCNKDFNFNHRQKTKKKKREKKIMHISQDWGWVGNRSFRDYKYTAFEDGFTAMIIF